VTVWGKLGEYAEAFKKGAQLLVEGELRSREYDGEKGHVKTYQIGADKIINLRTDQRVSPSEEPADVAA